MSFWLAHLNLSDNDWLQLLKVIYKSLLVSIINLGINLLFSSSINSYIKKWLELLSYLKIGFKIVLFICKGFKPSPFDWKVNWMWSNSIIRLSSIIDISYVIAAKNSKLTHWYNMYRAYIELIVIIPMDIIAPIIVLY